MAAAPKVSPAVAKSPTMSDPVQFNSRKEITMSLCLKLKLYFMGLYLTDPILHGLQGLGMETKTLAV